MPENKLSKADLLLSEKIFEAIITATEKRTQKTIDKLKTVAGRVLNK